MKAHTIVIAINDLAFGGGQRTVVEEANELLRRGIDVYILTTLINAKRDLVSQIKINGDRLIHIPFRSVFDIHGYRLLFRFLRRTRPRVVLSNLFYTNTIIRVAKIFFPTVRVVVREGNVPREKSIIVSLVDLALSLFTYRIISNSEHVKKSLRLQSFFSRTGVLYNGIDKKYFQEIPKDERRLLRASLGIPEEAPVILSVGSLVEKKGHLDLIDAYSVLPDTCHLVIAGEGHLNLLLKARAEEKKISSRVHFLGGRRDMEKVYGLADIFALPSHWEGMPNVLLEAMAAGLSSVVTDVGGISEIIEDGKNGYIIPAKRIDALSKKLSELVIREDKRHELGNAAKRSAERFSWQHHVDGLLTML